MVAAIPTGIEFANQFNLDYCIERYVKYKTIEDALKSNKIKLNELSEAYGEQIILGWIQAWLINLSKYMDFSVSEQQVKNTSLFILEDCYALNVVEITLIFRRIIKGYYGNFYGKFNGQIIINACKEYRKQRGIELSKLDSSEQDKIQNRND